jgi:osmotically-inducible protein OsmY
MKKTLLFATLVTGVALVGCNKSTRSTSASTDTTTPAATTAANDTAATANTASTTASADMRNAGADLRSAANNAGDALRNAGSSMASSARVMEWKLTANDINADLAAHRDIVRTKEASGAATGSMDRSVVKSAVEGRIKADSDLAALKLDVNPKGNGEVQLEGKAQTADQVGKAIALALDTDGVTKVTSKIKLDKDAVKH